MLCFFFLIFLFLITSAAAKEPEEQRLLEYTLEELGQVIFNKTFTLTQTDRRNIPAANTLIDRKMIENSGARDLDELLEIYVPSLLSLHHPTLVGRRFATRGIVSNDTVLILVNNRVMNERMFGGAQSERGLSMLGDIQSIEIIRGPGAAVHGAGGLAAVVSITTFSGSSFEGKDVTIRQGLIEGFTNAEFRFGKNYGHNNNLFLYYGVDSYEGGSVGDSPYVFGSDRSGFKAGATSTENVPPVNQSFRDKTRHKMHVQWNKGGLSAWARYLKGGVNIAGGPQRHGQMTKGGSGYDQFTLMLVHNKTIGKGLELETKFSYDFMNVIQIRDSEAWRQLVINNGETRNPSASAFVEQQYLTGFSLNWTPNDNHQLNLGYNFSYDIHGRDGFGWPHQDKARLGVPPWETTMHSLVSEYQWQVNKDLTFFSGVRVDMHSEIDKMLISPRTALVFRQDENRTFKLVFNKSVRRSDEASLKRFKEKDLEDIKYWDFIYHEQINDSLSLQLSAFYALHNLINFSSITNESRPIGRTEFAGFDWELHYRLDRWQTMFSLSYVKLLNLKLRDPSIRNSISAEPQGFGNDFAEVPNWVFKLHSQYSVNERWQLNGSLISHLGVDGRRDMFAGLRKQAVISQIDDGIVRLNLGTNYQYNKNLRVSLNAHNILGWVNRDLNNRFIRGSASFRPDVPSFSISLRYSL